MRCFIVTNPNLSVGQPGDIVTAAQLRMDDERLDQWVAAGFGVEVFESEVDEPEVFADEDRTIPPPPIEISEPEVYDASSYTVAGVLAYVEQNPGEAEAILSQELAGKNRSGIVEVLQG